MPLTGHVCTQKTKDFLLPICTKAAARVVSKKMSAINNPRKNRDCVSHYSSSLAARKRPGQI